MGFIYVNLYYRLTGVERRMKIFVTFFTQPRNVF